MSTSSFFVMTSMDLFILLASSVLPLITYKKLVKAAKFCLLISSSSFKSSFSFVANVARMMSNYLVTVFLSRKWRSFVSFMSLRKPSLNLFIEDCDSFSFPIISIYSPFTWEMAFLISFTSWSLCEPKYHLLYHE
jgi:hypothetical protein